MKKIVLVIFAIVFFIGIGFLIKNKNNNVFLFDDENILSKGENKIVNEKLINYYKTTGNRIFVILVKHIEGVDIDNYGKKLFNKKGLSFGFKGNTALLLINSKTQKTTIVRGRGMKNVLSEEVRSQIYAKINNLIKQNYLLKSILYFVDNTDFQINESGKKFSLLNIVWIYYGISFILMLILILIYKKVKKNNFNLIFK